MSGFTLRGRVDRFNDVLAEVKEFLREKKLLTPKAEDILETLADNCSDLFYLIPLE